MSDITVQWIVDILNVITIDKMKKQIQISELKKKLEESQVYIELKTAEAKLSDFNKQETDLKLQWKKVLLDSWIKKFESLDGTTIQLNKKPGKLVIENEDGLDEYKKEKTTVSIDKKQLKEDIKEWLIIEGVYIEEDYTLVIKQK